jgi:hypothetical protein
MPMFRRTRRALASVLLIVYLPACHHYLTPEGITPQEYIATRQPKQVRLTVNDITRGLRRFELLAPALGPGDSLTGLPRGEAARVTLAWSTIERFEARESNPTGTTGAVLGGVAVAGLVAVAVVAVIASSLCFESWGMDCD